MNNLMNISMQRKWVALSFSGAMLFLLSRILTVALQLWPAQNMPAFAHLARPHIHRVRISRKMVQATADPKAAERAYVDFKSFHLNSPLREYEIAFAGKVHCAGQPCQAEITIKASTTRNENIQRVIKTLDNGEFSIQIPVSELQDEHVDWKITAQSADGLNGEVHGRDILSNDPSVSIDAPLSLS